MTICIVVMNKWLNYYEINKKCVGVSSNNYDEKLFFHICIVRIEWNRFNIRTNIIIGESEKKRIRRGSRHAILYHTYDRECVCDSCQELEVYYIRNMLFWIIFALNGFYRCDEIRSLCALSKIKTYIRLYNFSKFLLHFKFVFIEWTIHTEFRLIY